MSVRQKREGRPGVAIRSGWVLACVFMLPCASYAQETSAHPAPPPGLQTLPRGEWRKIASQIPASRGIMAYSGGSFDIRHNAFLIFGGGHGDYWGNEVWKLDMASLQWSRMYEPSAYGKLDNLKGCVEGEDRPYTRHSYDHLVFVPTANEMFMWGGFGPTCYPRKYGGNLADETGPRRGGTSPTPSDAWTYSLAQNKWTSRFFAEKGQGYPRGPNGGTAYDSKRDRVWVKTGGTVNTLFSFNLQSNQWSKHALQSGDKPADLGNGAMVYLSGSDRLFTRSGWLIEPADEGRPCAAQQVGEALPKRSGGGSIVALGDGQSVFGLADDCESYRYDFNKNAWINLEMKVEGGKEAMIGSGARTREGRILGPYGRLQYSPHDDAVIVVLQSGVWACRSPVPVMEGR